MGLEPKIFKSSPQLIRLALAFVSTWVSSPKNRPCCLCSGSVGLGSGMAELSQATLRAHGRKEATEVVQRVCALPPSWHRVEGSASLPPPL